MSSFQSKTDLRSAIIEYIKSISWINPFGLTLTFKQQVNFQKLDFNLASSNIRHFMKRLNRMVFGSSAQRFQKGLKLFPVIETSADNRIHIHALIDCPDHIDPSEFQDKIDKAWSKTNFGYHHTHIQPIRDDGWSTYITKFNQKSEYDLAIDWMNVRNH